MTGEPTSSDPKLELRKQYLRNKLSKADLPDDPLTLLKQWLEDAWRELGDVPGSEPNAMALATTSPDGVPAVRMVLLRRIEENGLLFYTNYNSPKSQHLSTNPRCSVLFYWSTLERQVRIDGQAERLTDTESDAYFASRPIEHQLSAWASQQSQPVESRDALKRAFLETAQRFKDSPSIPRPAHWGGFRIRPTTFEFWQGGEHRLHDRMLATPTVTDGQPLAWKWQRLSP